MREIKFKIWDKKDKRWLWGPMYELNLFGETIIFGEILNGLGLERLDDLEPMQFTGLKDKNGKDIYEGDIVKWGDPKSSCGEGKAHVLYKEESARFDLMMKDGWVSLADEDGEIIEGLEVIGNIHENSGLLK